jgi:hypothetical protein
MTRILCEDNGQEGVVVATSKLSLGSVRAEQVGSLLRPQALLEARFARQSGELSDAALAKLEDEAILAALRGKRVTGQQVFVDGEFRRTGFMTGFPDSVEGFVLDAYAPIAWKGGTGNEGPSPNSQCQSAGPLSLTPVYNNQSE